MRNRAGLVKEIIWNVFVYILYYIYCFAMILLFHLIFYTLVPLNWDILLIVWMAFAFSAVMMLLRLFRKIRKEALQKKQKEMTEGSRYEKKQ